MSGLTAFRRVKQALPPSSRGLLTFHPHTSRQLITCTSLSLSTKRLNRHYTQSTITNMSFSNTEVPADKPADPYKAKNEDPTSLKEKVEDLVSFMERCKFAMMTTRIGSNGYLVSRCMALAAKVRLEPLMPSDPAGNLQD